MLSGIDCSGLNRDWMDDDALDVISPNNYNNNNNNNNNSTEVTSKTVTKVRDWGSLEDTKLLALYGIYHRDWPRIAQGMSGRSLNALKSRLRALLERMDKNWSANDDARLIALKSKYKGDWDAIVLRFPSRKVHSLRARWNYLNLKQVIPEIVGFTKNDPDILDLFSQTKKKSILTIQQIYARTSSKLLMDEEELNHFMRTSSKLLQDEELINCRMDESV